MAKVAVKDNSIWTKHVYDDEALRKQLESLSPGQTVMLRVNGTEGLWQKMDANGRTGKPTQGLKPLGPAGSSWRSLFHDSRGALVDLEVPTASKSAAGLMAPESTRWEEAPEADREAAWEAFKALRSAGWRSDKPYGPREELYDRDDR